MSQIELNGIYKTFKISQRPQGRFGLLKGALKREIKYIKALNDISFKINEGELVGYIGPNGAGKSTTVKIMSGILTPDQGDCLIMNHIPWKDRVAHVSRIGVVFGQRSQLWWDLPVSDSFLLLKDIYNINTIEYNKRLTELTDILSIHNYLQTQVRQLSLGQRMRCEIAASLLHRPNILFLDEPTIGLDAISKIALRDFLKNENLRHGVTMILTTHDMDDIESLCNRVMVIGHGTLLHDDGLEALKKRYSPYLKINAKLTQYKERCLIDEAKEIIVDGLNWTVLFDPSKITTHKMIERLSGLLPLKDISIEEENIDHIIASMYEEMCL